MESIIKANFTSNLNAYFAQSIQFTFADGKIYKYIFKHNCIYTYFYENMIYIENIAVASLDQYHLYYGDFCGMFCVENA